MSPAQLRRIRWAVRATLMLGVAASVAANILHARHNPIAQAIAAWPPLALLLTVELISRVPVHRRSLAAVRMVATATITGIAAWVSYWHMVGVALRYGETSDAAHLIPLSVDGLVVVASVCLVELGGRLAATVEAEVGPVELPPLEPASMQVTAAAEPAALPQDPVEAQPVAVTTEGRPAKPAGRRPASAPRRPFAVTQRAAASMQAGGMEVPEIAAALGVTTRQVRDALKPVPVTNEQEARHGH